MNNKSKWINEYNELMNEKLTKVAILLVYSLSIFPEIYSVVGRTCKIDLLWKKLMAKEPLTIFPKKIFDVWQF